MIGQLERVHNVLDKQLAEAIETNTPIDPRSLAWVTWRLSDLISEYHETGED